MGHAYYVHKEDADRWDAFQKDRDAMYAKFYPIFDACLSQTEQDTTHNELRRVVDELRIMHSVDTIRTADILKTPDNERDNYYFYCSMRGRIPT